MYKFFILLLLPIFAVANQVYSLKEILRDNEYIALSYAQYADEKLKEGDLWYAIQFYIMAIDSYKSRGVGSPLLLEKITSAKKYAEYLYDKTPQTEIREIREGALSLGN